MRRFGLAVLLMLTSQAAMTQSLKIYTEISPPSQFLAPDGTLTGFTVDQVREIQRRIGNHDPIVVVPWARGYQELQTRPDVVLFAMARNKERNPLFQWVGPIRQASYQFYVRSDAPVTIRSLEDARKLKLIGVYRDDVREQYLTRVGFTNLDRSVDTTIIVKKLMAGRVDAFVSAPDAIDGLMLAAGFQPKDVRPAFTFLKLHGYIAFSKDVPRKTVDAWSHALEAMKQDGTYERIFRNHFPGQAFTLPSPWP